MEQMAGAGGRVQGPSFRRRSARLAAGCSMDERSQSICSAGAEWTRAQGAVALRDEVILRNWRMRIFRDGQASILRASVRAGSLRCPFGDQHRNSVHNRIGSAAARAAQPRGVLTQSAPAGRTGQQAEHGRIKRYCMAGIGGHRGCYWTVASGVAVEPAEALEPLARPAATRFGRLANSSSMRLVVPALANSQATRMPLKMARSFDEP